MTSRLSAHDRERMTDIMAGYGDWFSAQLLRLIAKADVENRARLRLAFPDHVEAFEAWHMSMTVEEYRILRGLEE
jgi:hypothetical protein